MSGILFDKKSFIIKPWKVKISLEKEDLSTIPIWVHLPALAMQYWGERCIRKIAGLLGNVLKVDNATKSKDRLMYARALIEMDIKKMAYRMRCSSQMNMMNWLNKLYNMTRNPTGATNVSNLAIN